MRETWEAAEALAKLGLDTRITARGNVKVYRDGVRIGTLRFPRER